MNNYLLIKNYYKINLFIKLPVQCILDLPNPVGFDAVKPRDEPEWRIAF